MYGKYVLWHAFSNYITFQWQTIGATLFINNLNIIVCENAQRNKIYSQIRFYKQFLIGNQLHSKRYRIVKNRLNCCQLKTIRNSSIHFLSSNSWLDFLIRLIHEHIVRCAWFHYEWLWDNWHDASMVNIGRKWI